MGSLAKEEEKKAGPHHPHNNLIFYLPFLKIGLSYEEWLMFSLWHSGCTHHKIHSVWCASVILILACPKSTEGCRSIVVHETPPKCLLAILLPLRTLLDWMTAATTDVKCKTQNRLKWLNENSLMSSFQLTLRKTEGMLLPPDCAFCFNIYTQRW